MPRILVIDDDDLVREMLSQMLTTAGYEVVVAANGCQGVELFRLAPTDLIITDIIMPQRDGWEAIAELRREFRDVKIIAISGGGKIGPFSYLMMAKRLGAQRVFPKPLRREELLRAVREMLES